MIANCRAAGIVQNVSNPLQENDNNNDNIMQCYERAMINRSIIERESIDFVRNIDKEILLQYLSPLELQKLFNNNNNYNNNTNNNRQSTIDFQEFQNILSDLLIKLKDDLHNVNKTLDHHHQQHFISINDAQNEEQNNDDDKFVGKTYLQHYHNYHIHH
ncbi:hypothetical protein BLA29_006404 [Euroglyphus maynei]|uniref:Uncharacterized protein n=1 Tax=Euroglyphus maynei TaxID=6958 RepID=A0A1Y3AWC9_EURMA|nr:hypothetical protein BLA29_006404 [Euroglyphus maynei]